MKKYLYYPGCTLHERAKNYDTSGRAAAEALGIELQELENWSCCGTTFPLTDNKIVGMLPGVRTLIKTVQGGEGKLVTLCSFCYNVLKRAHHHMKTDDLERKRINAYLQDEFEREGKEFTPYEGQVRVMHLLEVLRDDIGWDAVEEQVKRPLEGLKAAAYYGCTLLRPAKELEFDDVENPRILEDMLAACGAEIIDFPHRTECCGSYLGLSQQDAAVEQSRDILRSATRFGADVVVVACPLCAYNMDDHQEKMRHKFLDHKPIPIVYFTQLLALACGADEKACGWERHKVDPRPAISAKETVKG